MVTIAMMTAVMLVKASHEADVKRLTRSNDSNSTANISTAVCATASYIYNMSHIRSIQLLH